MTALPRQTFRCFKQKAKLNHVENFKKILSHETTDKKKLIKQYLLRLVLIKPSGGSDRPLKRMPNYNQLPLLTYLFAFPTLITLNPFHYII